LRRRSSPGTASASNAKLAGSGTPLALAPNAANAASSAAETVRPLPAIVCAAVAGTQVAEDEVADDGAVADAVVDEVAFVAVVVKGAAAGGMFRLLFFGGLRVMMPKF